MSKRHCKGCQQDLPRSAFGLDCSRPGGLQLKCRPCTNAAKRATHRSGAGVSAHVIRMLTETPDLSIDEAGKMNYAVMILPGVLTRTVVGACDAALADLKAKGLVQFPTVVGGIVPILNVQGIAPGSMPPKKRFPITKS